MHKCFSCVHFLYTNKKVTNRPEHVDLYHFMCQLPIPSLSSSLSKTFTGDSFHNLYHTDCPIPKLELNKCSYIFFQKCIRILPSKVPHSALKNILGGSKFSDTVHDSRIFTKDSNSSNLKSFLLNRSSSFQNFNLSIQFITLT